MQLAVHDSIGEIPAADWDRIAGRHYPFLHHAFLLAAERSGSADAASGWQPRHLSLRAADGTLRGALLLYEKNHSWGEFVFDWAWANAYKRAGLEYYPKLVAAVPFTPASCPKLLLAEPGDGRTASLLLESACSLAADTGCSSVHLLFPTQAEMPLALNAGFRIRKDCQFHWHNRDYADFEAFLAEFSSSKRKKARRERRRVSEAGIVFRRLRGGDLDARRWQIVYDLIARTFRARGGLPYLTQSFFQDWSAADPDNVLVIQAETGGSTVAAAVFYEGEDTLYGRYWGSRDYYDALHFETCYYQGIDYCIERGLRRFEPGTQGEHKISRGFLPVATWSGHWLTEPAFHAAVGDYVAAEAEHIDRYMQAVGEHSPFRRGPSS